ncbi:hypothetical protein SAMN04488058_10855 [Deinococcus reticulitermitis]|uniref:Uncharacterized protein n=1 Tax=Deinococcus reticulitermitis TaxID=856736 RepID=A0A1H6YX33_9DEIO|nr:hypothetical protein [Deinococcus reticulitermitis]SEJ44384.1 hypothetical protein SAMN04488058_10855 [Deinococcus reticulitermitis]
MFGFLRPKAAPNPYVRQDDPQTYRVRVRTQRHGETVEFRFTKGAHIGIDDSGNYFFRKPVVSPRFLDRGELLVQFDNRYNVTGVSGEGLDFVPVSEWQD